MSQLTDVVLSSIRAEDLTDLPPEVQRGLEPLLRFVNNGIQGLARAVTGNVSLTDNLRGEVQTVNLSHGAPLLVSLKKLSSARGIIAISVGSADGKIQHALKAPLHITGTTVQNQVKVTAWFADATAVRVPVTFLLTPEGSYSAIFPQTTP